MALPSPYWLLAAAAFHTGMGCSAAPSKVNPASLSLLERVKASEAHEQDAARWHYHPSDAAALYDAVPLGRSETLLVGANGERWVVDAGAETARASPWLASGDLVAVLQRDAKWIFVERHGVAFESEEPLGPFLETYRPPEPLVGVAGNDRLLAGVTRGGRLRTSHDAARSWIGAGPPSPRFVDVAVDEEGNGLALAVPEALWTRAAEDAEWQCIDAKPVGATAVTHHRGGGLVVTGALEDFRYHVPGRRLESLDVAPQGAELSLGVPLPPSPSAQAVWEGRAALEAMRYRELRRRKGGWDLLEGPIAGPLVKRRAEALGACGGVRLASRGDRVAVVCGASEELAELQPFTLLESEDGGRTWFGALTLPRGMLGESRLALGSDGMLLLTGICPPHAADAGCAPRGVYWHPSRSREAPDSNGKRAHEKRAAPPDARLEPAALPGFTGVADALLFSADGTRAHVVGRRGKTGQYGLYLTGPSTKTFAVSNLGPLPSPFVHGDMDSPPTGVRRGSFIADVAAGEDGHLAVHLERRGEHLLVVVGRDGRIRSIARPPRGAALLGIAGLRSLAIDPGSGRSWESSDGGVTWGEQVALPRPPCPGDASCSLPFVCGSGGCLLTEEWSRTGWGAPRAAAAAPPGGAPSPVEAPELQAPWVCDLVSEEPWQRVEGAWRAPTADETAIGQTAWHMIASDAERAAVSMTMLRRGARLPERRTLFAPARAPEGMAMAVSRQVEGAAALRYVVPSTESSPELRAIEIAWLNLFTDALVRTRLPSAEPFRPGDFVPSSRGALVAKPNLISIASDGLFLRIHASPAKAQSTLFSDGKRVSRVPPLVLPERVQGARHEMARLGGASVALIMKDDGVVLRGSPEGSSWNWSALTLLLPDARSFAISQRLEITYLDRSPALQVVTWDDSAAAAAIYPIQRGPELLGRPTSVPTLKDLGGELLACSTWTFPRVVSPPLPGTRTPVVVRDAVEPDQYLLSGQAVLYGTPQQACVASMEARAVAGDGAGRELSALLFPADMGRAWAFRSSLEGGERTIELRPMACQRTAEVTLPAEVSAAMKSRQAGTR